MNSNDEVVRVIESRQIVKLERSAKNVWESRKVETCSRKENFRSIPYLPSSEPVHYQTSSPNWESGKIEPYSRKENFRSIPYLPSFEPVHYQTLSPDCASGISSAHTSPCQPLRQNNRKRTPGQFIQISEITPNNIIRFLSDLRLNPNSLSTWNEYDVSKFLKHPYLNLMSYEILESMWYRYCYQVTSTTTCCFNSDNINGIALIYICLGKRKFHYYTENQFPDFNELIKQGFIMCKCAKKFIHETRYNNRKRLSYLVERICQCFLERQYMIDKLLSR